ncbi:hypothetical protein [Wolbachia endosymbiont (group A) of Anomoia purmunda]|uniref:hypothetical protein n=1 Tax=Wolbachia endosymbiont (group A) of Anomoia purmunda TaxID=2953978 RepID=UPI00222F790D|nr:hypothetical protein [Wolbachia endosymbiont (group A) of Anomoia purmunda]
METAIKQQTPFPTFVIETATDIGTTTDEDESSEKILNLNTTAIKDQNTTPKVERFRVRNFNVPRSSPR